MNLDYNRVGKLRDAVDAMQRAQEDLEKAEEGLKDATDRLLEDAQLPKKL